MSRRLFRHAVLTTVTVVALSLAVGLVACDGAENPTAQAQAEQGSAAAQFNLGLKYDNGEGVPQDDAAAVAWYRKAAEQGHPAAQFNLGLKYDNGAGVPQDDAAAVAWYCLAAEQGSASAQVSLGALYSDSGRSVPQDLVEGHTWLNLAASRLTGEQRDEAVTARDRVAEQMTPADLSKAQHRAREWNAAHQVGVDIAPGTDRTSSPTAGMPPCSYARLSLYLKHALSIEDLTTGWLDGGGDEFDSNKLVPTISFRLANVSSEQVRKLQLNVIFRRCVVSDEFPRLPPPPGYIGRDPYPAAGTCAGEVQEWGSSFMSVTGPDGLEPGQSTEPITARSNLGYTGSQTLAQLLLNREFVDAKAELFVKQGAERWVELGEYQIERQLLTQ